MNGQLIQTRTTDDLILSAFYSPGDKNKPLLLHVHGYTGTFFANPFIHEIAKTCEQMNSGFLTIETRGSYERHGLPIYGKGYSSHGGWIELLEEACRDIDAWVQWALTQGYKEIVLQGHSLGTFKVTRYLFEGKNAQAIKKLILLCPFDKQGIIEMGSKGKWREYLKEAATKVAQGLGVEMIPEAWGSEPLSYQTFISWYQENDFNMIFNFSDPDYHSDLLGKITIPCKIIVGEKDEFFFPTDFSRYSEILEKLCQQFTNGESLLIPQARHSFRGHEELLTQAICAFVYNPLA